VYKIFELYTPATNFSVPRVVSCIQTDGQTEKLEVALRRVANALKNGIH